jgi:nicotinate-nucleotide pyrophosphorylase (carboxylating)
VNLDLEKIRPMVRKALDEDIGTGDVTTESIVPSDVRAEAEILAKEPGLLAGIPVVVHIFQLLDADMRSEIRMQDGQQVNTGDVIMLLSGSARAILSGERVALNFLQRLSGIATATARFVRAVAGCDVRILDTRKTTPNLRYLEKYAVALGGGQNHRMGLFDMVLIKDNHIQAAGGIEAAVKKVRDRSLGLPVEVETATLEQVMQAVRARVDRIMLDNMGLDDIKKAVAWIHEQSGPDGRPRIEVSGNITLENIRQVALTGVDDISAGSITHSSTALDVSLKITKLISPVERRL